MLEFQRQLEADVCEALEAQLPALRDELRRLRRCWELDLSVVDQALEQRLLEARAYEQALPACPARALAWQGYVVEREVGRGAAGVVYRARRGEAQVALKLLRPGSEGFPAQLLRRFEREAELLARLEHRGIVRLVAAGVACGQPFQATEWLAGGSLVAKGGDLPRRGLRCAALLADALAYAHAAGVVHRDLKPSNVLLDPAGWPKLVDFGLAKALDSEESLTASRSLLGTPEYAAPELLGWADEAGPPSDVYGLTALLHYLLTGRPPFEASTLQTLRRGIQAGPRPVAAALGLPAALDELLRRGLDPDLRIRLGLDELRQELEVMLAGLA